MTAQPTPGPGLRWGPSREPVPPAALRSWLLWKMGCLERWGPSCPQAWLEQSLGTRSPSLTSLCLPRQPHGRHL